LTYDADCILVPILPSIFDVQVTTNFIAELLLLTDFDLPVAVVANRTRQNTRSLKMLMRILENLETPTIAVLGDSQNYVHAAAHGLGIYEMPHCRVRQDLEQMGLIIDWLDRQLTRMFEPTLISRVNPVPKLFASSAFGHSHRE
jgi:chromosome partitioning protein